MRAYKFQKKYLANKIYYLNSQRPLSSLENGQALLIVLLSMAVILTVVLSILSRSVTDVAVTSRGEESVRAFSAAEAGVEQALIGAPTSGTLTGSSFDAEVVDIGKNLTSFVYPLGVESGDTATVWLVSHDDNGSLVCDGANPCHTGSSVMVCWGADQPYPDPSLMPAIEVISLYLNTPGNNSTARVARATFDGNSSRRSLNNFDVANASGCNIDTESFAYSANVDFAAMGIPSSVYSTPNGMQLLAVRMLYNTDTTHKLGVSTFSSIFPSQGTHVNSTGISGEAIRKVSVLRLFPDLPPTFYSAVFAPVGVSK